MDTKPIRNEGKDIAQHFRVFRCGYRIIKDPTRGVLIAGASPDGRYTGTCDRCGTAILNVSCFASDDPERPGFMHVGIDCAQRMGVPLSELRKARTYVRNHERSKRREAAAKVAKAAQQEREAVRREAYKPLLDRLAAVSENSNASDFERDWCDRKAELVVSAGFEPREIDWLVLDSAETRLALCESSVAQEGKAVTTTFTVYRTPIALDGFYGVTLINFFHDQQGNAYVHKGSKSWGYPGSEFTATFSIKGKETRDGLVSTQVNRPRKSTEHSYIDCHGNDLSDEVG